LVKCSQISIIVICFVFFFKGREFLYDILNNISWNFNRALLTELTIPINLRLFYARSYWLYRWIFSLINHCLILVIIVFYLIFSAFYIGFQFHQEITELNKIWSYFIWPFIHSMQSLPLWRILNKFRYFTFFIYFNLDF